MNAALREWHSVHSVTVTEKIRPHQTKSARPQQHQCHRPPSTRTSTYPCIICCHMSVACPCIHHKITCAYMCMYICTHMHLNTQAQPPFGASNARAPALGDNFPYPAQRLRWAVRSLTGTRCGQRDCGWHGRIRLLLQHERNPALRHSKIGECTRMITATNETQTCTVRQTNKY